MGINQRTITVTTTTCDCCGTAIETSSTESTEIKDSKERQISRWSRLWFSPIDWDDKPPRCLGIVCEACTKIPIGLRITDAGLYPLTADE